MPIGLNNTDIQVDYGGGNVFNVDIPKYVLETTTETSGEELPVVNKDALARTQYVYGSDVTSGLVAHYKFDGDTNDSSGNGNHITTISGTIDYHTINIISGQSSLIGANEYVEITSSNVLNAVWSGAFTISFWLYPTTSDKEYLVGGWDNATSGGLRGGWYITARNGNVEWPGLTGGSFSTTIATDNNIVANAWNHISISNTGTTFNISLNGINKTIIASNTLDTPHTNIADRHIGISRAKRWGGSGYDYDNNGGYYDDFRVYNRVLSAAEISNLYNLSAVNIQEGDISGTNDKYIAYKYIGGNDNGSGQSEYNLHFNNPVLCDVLVVAGGGAGGGNEQGGGGGAGALIYYEDIILQGDYTIKVGNGGTNGNAANVGDSGSDSEFKRTSDGKQQFLAKGGGGGGTSNSAGNLPGNGGSGGGGAGDSTSGTIIDDANIVNGIVINVINTNVNVVEHYDITMFSGDRGVDSLNDVGCFGNNGGIEQFGGPDDWGAGGGGAGSKGKPTSESAAIQYAGDGGSGKKYNITGTDVYYAAGGGGGIRPDTNSLNTAQVGAGGLGGGGAGGGGGTAYSAVDSNGDNGEPHTGSGGGGVGASIAADYKGGDGGSGIVVVRYKNENISSDVYIPQGDNATEYTILDSDNTNLVAHYKFDEGEEYTDSASGVHNLIDLGKTSSFSTNEKVFGKSAHESGTEAKIQFTDSIASQISEISSTTGITFSFWFNMNTSSGAWASLFEFSNTENDTTLTNRIGISKNNTTNNIWIGIKEDNVTTSITCGVVDNEWHHITWSIDNKGTWQVYFDGVNQYPNKFKQIPQIYNYDYSYLFGNVQSSQTNGYIDDFRIYNKVLNQLEIHYLANKSIKLVPKEIDSEYNLLTFLYHNDLNSEDNGQTEYNLTFDSPTECDILIVGGGGGGGHWFGGGGGAGGVVYETNINLHGQYILKVGKGGSGAVDAGNSVSRAGTNGDSSEFNSIIAIGGGGGGAETVSASDGGSGGGAGYKDANTQGIALQTGENAFGNSGSSGNNKSGPTGLRHNGGGGGAGSEGFGSDGQSAPHGGDGMLFNITGHDNYYAGGGGGANANWDGHGYNAIGNGGSGIGGNGGAKDVASGNGQQHTGSGGGGGNNTKGGDGGSGIVLVRYKRTMGTPTITTTSKLAQWTYSASNPNVYHSGNVGIGTFPVANYSLNVKGNINAANLYKDGCLIGTGKIKENDYSFSYFTCTPNVSSTTIPGTSYKYIVFKYDPDNDNGSGQTEYEFNLLSDINCDILLVGGGGGGGAFGGGGGGGGLLFTESVSLEGSNEYTIKVGNGGAGAPTYNNGVNGTNGYNSSININGSDYIAVGGGGGGTRNSNNTGKTGNTGGSGGGGSHSNSGGAASGGTSTQLSYYRWESYGNSGGKGRNGTGGGAPDHSSGGGGGAGYQGEDAIQSTQGDRTWSTYGGGGDGGIGMDFSSYFGTNVGHNGWFAGGGGGQTYNNGGRVGWGNSYNGTHDNIRGFGGGGDGGFNGSPAINPQKGIEHTGGGGGGAQTSTAGASGGSGIVIIRYLDTSHTNEPNITNNSDNMLIEIVDQTTEEELYNIMTFKYLNDIVSDMHPTFSQDAAHLIAHYKFDGNYEDSNPQSTKYHLTNVDTELVIDGNIKSVLIDNDADELYTTNNMPAITSTSAYSWCCWVKRNEERHGANHFVFSQGVSSSTAEVGALFLNNNRLRFYVFGYDLDITIAFNDIVVMSRYNHFVFTINNNTIKIYENGILRGSRSVSANIATNNLYIGKRGTTYSRINVADFRVYDKELSANEVYQLYTLYNGQTSYSVTFNEPTECDILVVGGGGSGGVYGGGGGGGDVIYESNVTLNGQYKIKVGNGGLKRPERVNSGTTGDYNDGKPGLFSAIYSISGANETLYRIAGGGGAGDGWAAAVPEPPIIYEISNGYPNNSQGGGGGAGMYEGTNIIGQGIISTYSGNGANSNGTGTRHVAGGGGGGSSGDGSEGVVTSSTLTNGGKGGDGNKYDIIGQDVYYGGGGGGGGGGSSGNLTNLGGAGGLGGGGTGDNKDNNDNDNIIDGVNGLGGGGGGGNVGNTSGGNGGSGIIIIRYKATLSSPITYKLKEWKYSNASISYFMGNVGIGVTNPSVALDVDGTILKKAGINFKIQHPLDHNKWLYHTGLEGPRYDNIYRGKKVISGGYGEINIDTDCNSAGGMSSGTFEALNNNPFLYLRNNQTFDNVIGYIDNGIIKVNCENTSDDIEVEWMVIGERKDNAIKKSQLTDNQGRLLCERQL